MAHLCPSENEYPSIVPSVTSKKDNAENTEIVKPSLHISEYGSDISSEFQCPVKRDEKPIDFNKFKKILQQPSKISGDNLYNHLVEIIKRTLDQRPRNVVDYFELFSRDVRKRKVPGEIDEPEFLFVAKYIKDFIQPPDLEEQGDYMEEFELIGESGVMSFEESTDSIRMLRTISYNENIIQIQHVLSFCGFGFDIDEIFLLSLAVQKVQQNPFVENARFWGRIYGLKGSYYIVEALLTKSQIEERRKDYKLRRIGKMKDFINKREVGSLHEVNMDLIPGTKWQNYPEEDLDKMVPIAGPIPKLVHDDVFEEPEEPTGTGLNRWTYFVTTCLGREWQELPNVAPKHIRMSKKIKKFLTGELHTELLNQFPGSEAHYLRAMIARITSGSFIAPQGFYMRGKECKFGEGEGEEFECENEDILGNDAPVVPDPSYKPLSLDELALASNWVHVRPYILNQGRVVHVNAELEVKELERRVMASMNEGTQPYEDLGEEEGEDENKEVAGEDEDLIETGPELFTPCSKDRNTERVTPWTSRYSSVYSNIEQMILMRSNLWPGAYAIAYENFSECIYLGWGSKYVAKSFPVEKLPDIEDIDYPDIATEATDPTPEMEEKWRLYHMKPEIKYDIDEMSDVSVEEDYDDLI